MKKKPLTIKLRLNKETLRDLSDRELGAVVGGWGTAGCYPTGTSVCHECNGPTVSCLSGGSCPSGPNCC